MTESKHICILLAVGLFLVGAGIIFNDRFLIGMCSGWGAAWAVRSQLARMGDKP
jgi:hypothetical protein